MTILVREHKSQKMRIASSKDIDRIYEIENSLFFHAWTKENIRGELVGNRLIEAYVLEIDERVQAYYFAWHIAGESSLNKIAVSSDYQGLGLGHVLMQHFLDRAGANGSEEIFLEVSRNNGVALSLYESYGFEKVGIRENYYEKTHEDAFIMRKKVGD